MISAKDATPFHLSGTWVLIKETNCGRGEDDTERSEICCIYQNHQVLLFQSYQTTICSRFHGLSFLVILCPCTEPPHDKANKMTVHPAKTQISLGIHLVWSESSLCAQWVAKDPSFLHANSEDSDQPGRMPRLIWVFAGCTCHFVGFVMRQLYWIKGTKVYQRC